MRLLVLTAICLVALAGCDSNPAQPTCTYTLSATSMTMGASGGAGSITVSTGSGCSWTGSSAASWITATGGTSASGPGTFTFNVAALTGSASRTGSLTVAGQSVSVTQQGAACAYTLTPASRTIDAAGATAAFDVSTDAACAWTAATTAPWLSIVTGGAGSGNGTVIYRAAANPDAASRTGSLTAGGQSHTVTQTGVASCRVDLSKYQDTFSAAGGAGSFDVIAPSTCAWVAASGASWVRVTDPTGGSGTGSRRVTYSVDPNAGTGSRSGEIAVGGTVFTVSQAGSASCEYSVAPVDFRECNRGGFERTVAVTTASGCGWTAAPAASWLTVLSGQSGLGPGHHRVQVHRQLRCGAAGQRRGAVADADGGPERARVPGGLHVRHDEGTPSDVAAAGGAFNFDVFASPTNPACGGPLQDVCMWNAVSSASWVTVLTSMPRYGDDRVFISVAINGTGGRARPPSRCGTRP